jgi:hypothetical protein
VEKWKFHFPSAWNSLWKRCGSFHFIALFHGLKRYGSFIAQMKISEKISERLLLGLITGLSGAIGVLVTSIAKDAIEPFLQNVLPVISNKTLLLLSLLLLLVVFLLVAYILFLRFEENVPIQEKYVFDSVTGISTLKKKPHTKICSRCLLTGVVVPLLQGETKDKWYCINSACQQDYYSKKDTTES